LLQQGASMIYVKEQLGQGSIQITVDRYGHLISGANRAAVERLDDEAPRQPDATQATGLTRQAETIAEMQELFRKSGEPNLRQLEPDWRMAQAARSAPARSLSGTSTSVPLYLDDDHSPHLLPA
jgi:hypothetical protein